MNNNNKYEAVLANPFLIFCLSFTKLNSQGFMQGIYTFIQGMYMHYSGQKEK